MSNNLYQITKIDCGRDHFVALLKTGKIMAWGGIGSSRVIYTGSDVCYSPQSSLGGPIEVNTQYKLKSLAAGYGVNLGITDLDKVVFWGNSSIGIVNSKQESFFISDPEILENLPNAKDIKLGEHNYAMVDLNGKVYTWGMNVDGVLGRHTTQTNSSPALVQELPPIKSIAMGQGSAFGNHPPCTVLQSFQTYAVSASLST